MGFFEEMSRLHGEDTVVQLKLWANTNRKLTNYSNHKTFLIKCRQKKILPLHISQTSKCLQNFFKEEHPFINRCHNILVRFQKSVLNIEIQYTHWKVNNLKTTINNCKEYLRNTLTQSDFDTFSRSQDTFYKNQTEIVKEKQFSKFNKLINMQKGVELNTFTFNNKWLINLTDLDIPQDIKILLSLGDKFNLPYTKEQLPIDQLIIDIEYILEQCNDSDKITLRNQCINILTNFINSNHSNYEKHFNYLLDCAKKTFKFVKDHSDEVVITRADKGNNTVLIKRSEYEQKTLDSLSDTSTYVRLNKDPTITIQNKLNKLIDQLKSNNSISKETTKYLKTTNGVPPKIYFLPKIHKTGIPLRPIVSFVNSPLYNLTKFISGIIGNAFIKDQRHVKDSFEFSNFIQQQKVPNDYILVSLDVISLFTNIPVELVSELIQQRWQLIEPHTTLNLNNVITLFNFCIDNNYFQYKDTFYKQTFGLGMGNCMSPICADIVMSELQDKCINQLSFNLPFFCRYVDDIITAIPNTKCDEIITVFNRFHPRLQFTLEQENNVFSLPFLDIKVIRQIDGTLLTDWYHKPTFSERFLNYYSEHPVQQKINIINNLKHRSLKLSSPQFHEKNISYIRTILLKNNYPQSLINKILFQNHNPVVHNHNENQTKKYFKIPYINSLSERIKRTIQNKLDNVTIALKSENTLKKRFFTKLKSKDNTDYLSNVVYKIPCNSCSSCYVGQTGRYLKQRLREHANDCKNFLTKRNPTALVEHKINTGHNFNFEKTTVIATESNYKKRLLQEMVSIKKENKTVNKRTDIDNLSSSYYNLIDRDKT